MNSIQTSINIEVQKALAKKDYLLGSTLLHRALANSWLCRICEPEIVPELSDRISAHNRPDHAQPFITETNLRSRDAAPVEPGFQDQKTVITSHTSPESYPASYQSEDTIEMDYLGSGDGLYDDDDEIDSALLVDFPVSLEEINSDTPTLTGLTWSLENVLIDNNYLSSGIGRQMTNLSSVLEGTTCNYEQFKTLIHERYTNQYTPIIENAISIINQLEAINNDQPVNRYALIIQQSLHEAFLQVYV